MAEITVSNDTSFVNENGLIHVTYMDDETPVVSSLDVARHFQKKHQHVLRDIDRIIAICPESFCASNFGRASIEVPQPNGGTRQIPAYQLTRDAFSLLAMGFTGSAALRWKIKYIEVFNCLEAGVRSNIRTDALEEARALPAIEADRKQAYLDGMAEGGKLAEKRDGLNLLLRAKAYIDKGLNKTEAATLCGVNRRSLHRLIVKSRKVGL